MISNTTISNNRTNWHGGGIYCSNDSNPTISNNTISGNSTPKSGRTGGGIYCSGDSNPIISNNIITGNSSGSGGGITYSGSYSNPILSGNIISNNSAHSRGGGIYYSGSSLGMDNNTISGNSAFEGGGIYTGGVLNATWSNNTISNNSADYGGGIYDNSSYTSDPIWTNNIFDGNTATVEGGGIWNAESSPTLSYNTISNNSTDGKGGGIYFYHSFPNLTNNTIGNNSADNGGGIYCTYYSSPVLKNTILWGNSAASGNEVYLDGNYSDPDFYYCDVEGGTAAFGLSSGVTFNGSYENNIDDKPLFVYPGNGDYHLTIISPCIDAGDPTSPLDPDGTIVDIGTFYYDQSQNTLDAQFTADVTSGYAQLMVQFTDLSSGNPISWEWDFQNDGTIDSDVQNPEWIYNEAGTYTVSLTVSDGGSEETNIKENYITVVEGPAAGFTADITSGYAPLEVSFEDLSTQGLGVIVEWFWDFGDGNTSSLQNPVNIYQNVGLYTVSLAVTDDDDVTNTQTKTDYIVLHTTIINVPGDFATIQEGIDASVNGDTVLVHPGTYVEHINFNGKNITVASLFLTTQNATYISQTRIDGNNIGKDLTLDVVTFNNGEDSTSVLTGFTITNGNYGIYCLDYSSPAISNNSIINNGSRGINCFNYSSPSICNNTISNNSIGIYCKNYSSPLISNNTISDHSDASGIYCYRSYPTISNNKINYNKEGIYCTRMSHPAISNNTINYNSVGIECWDWASPTISKNTIGNSTEYGIKGYGTAKPSVLNNIFYNNVTGINISGGVPQSLDYNLFWLNGNDNAGYAPPSFGDIVIVNANADSCDLYYNLFTDPLFVDPGNSNFQLTSNSPCIDAGNPDPIYYDPDGTVADIGAFYFDQSQLNVDFSATPTSGNAPLLVNFTDLSYGNPIAWAWDFENDGTIDSDVQNPEWIYTEPGTYTVSLTIGDGINSDTETKTDYITVIAVGPTADFSSDVTSGDDPLEVTFTDQSTQGSGIIDEWNWDFGDGNNSTLQNPAHIYETPGTYTVSLTVTDEYNLSDTETKVDYITILSSGVHFDPVWTAPYNPMTFYIVAATIDDADMQAGDEVGLFDIDPNTSEEICVGSGVLTQPLTGGVYLEMIASMDDGIIPGQANGFTPGHTILYRLWNETTGEVTNVSSNYPYPGYDEVYTSQGSAFVELAGLLTVTQDISFITAWNLMSLRVEPENMDMLDIVQPLIDEEALYKVLDEDGGTIFHLPFPPPNGQWSNTIGDMATTEGYYVKTLSDATLQVTGSPVVTPLNIPLHESWNIIGYPCQQPQDALAAVQPLIDAGVLYKVIDETGGTIFHLPFPPPNGQWTNTIGNFETGKGYYVNLSGEAILTLDCPTGDDALSNYIPRKIETSFFQPVFENNPYMPMNVILLPDENLMPGDEIGIFDGDVCVGATVFNGITDEPVFITVSADDPYTEWTDGFITGNNVAAKVWASQTNQVSNIEIELIEGISTFGPLETCVGKMTMLLTDLSEVPDEMFDVKVQPNPFKNSTNVVLSLHATANVKISIMNLNGITVKQFQGQTIDKGQKIIKLNATNLRSGVYTMVVEFTYRDRVISKFLKVVII
jgi:parallel beta-helix repeat protein